MKKLITVCTMVLAICCFGHTIKELEQQTTTDVKKIQFIIENAKYYPRELKEMVHELQTLHSKANRKELACMFASLEIEINTTTNKQPFIMHCKENIFGYEKHFKWHCKSNTCNGKLWHFIDVGQNGMFPMVCEHCLDKMMKLVK